MLVKRLKTRGREVQQQEYAENALIRDSDLSGGRGGSRIFLGGGALVSCSTSTPINHIVFFFFFCRIPVVLENRRSFQEGGCAPPAPPPPHLDPPLRWITRYQAFEQLGPGSIVVLPGRAYPLCRGGGDCENILHTFL